MADIDAAVRAVLLQEDANLSGVITDAADDRGGCTRFGLTQRWHPELIPCGFFSGSMPGATALALAAKTYVNLYADSLQLAGINDQRLANSLLSLAVVSGTQTAVKLLQSSLIALGFRLTADGLFGPQTLEAVNGAPALSLLPRFVAAQKEHFIRIANADPTQEANLAGWLNRADSIFGRRG